MIELQSLARVVDLDAEAILFKEIPIVELCGGGATPLFGALPYRDTEIWALSGDPSQAKEHLGWSASTSLRDGLIKTIEWHQRTASESPAASLN